MRAAVAFFAVALVGCALIRGGAPSAGRQQAQAALQKWADFTANFPPDTIVFVNDLTQGGGWNGSHADDAKIAFLGGAVEAAVDLPAEQPPPPDVLWSDGTRQQVPVISAAAALAGMVAELKAGGGKCDGCTPLHVVSATLDARSAITSRGDASVPVWQFEFAPGEEPIDPISYVALKDHIAPMDWGASAYAASILGASGKAPDTQLTVMFMGGQCDASHSVEAVESTSAIALIVSTTIKPGPCTGAGVLYSKVVQLAVPLGSRVVLDAASGFPVPVYEIAPAGWPVP